MLLAAAVLGLLGMVRGMPNWYFTFTAAFGGMVAARA